MKTIGSCAGIAFIFAALTVVSAADKPASNVRSNAVSELRSHDNAFALMMESYRQMQVLMIEADYDKRLQLAKTVADPTERDRVLLLAQQEHDLRISKLHQTMKSFDSAYNTTRKPLQNKAGGEVVTKITSEEAGEQLRHFRAFTPQEFKMENQASSLLPAGARLLYDDKRY
jgi:hypothetical protein